MITTDRPGTRVAAAVNIHDVHGWVLRGTRGVVCYPVERLGSKMLAVEFESGQTSLVYPDEIEEPKAES